MKKFALIALAVFTFVSCKDPKAYVMLSGKVEHAQSTSIEILSKDFIKTIELAADGSFKDTLVVNKGLFTLTDGKNRTLLFLDNGYELDVQLNADDFSQAVYSGKGKESNIYLQEKLNFGKTEYANPNSYFTLDPEQFRAKISDLRAYNNSISIERVDSIVIAQVESDNKRYIDYLEKNYEMKYAMLTKYARGKPSPKFNNYENYTGGTTSLDDLKGKYVYIDVWATWCGPCKQQIPYLKQIEEQYEKKNIAFVSISTDRQNKYDAWRKMIEDKAMGGIQLFAGEDYSFQQAYQINSIPRFLLIDPDGNIVSADAPRPSDPKLKELFDSLEI